MISRLRPIHLVLLLIFVQPVAFGESPELAPQPIDAEWTARWREDLAFAKKKMPEVHLRIDHSTTRAAIDAAIDNLAERIPTLTHHEAVVELARIVAMIGDGHTRLTLPLPRGDGHRRTEPAKLPGAPFHRYPMRFFLYDDGLAVEKTIPEHAELLGARVDRIGRMTADEAMKALEPIVHRDNAMQVQHILPIFLSIPELLHARGVIDTLGPVPLELQTLDGKQRRITLEPVAPGDRIDWAEPAKETVPGFRRNLDRNYSFEYLEEERTVHFRYVTVGNDDGETLAAFSDRMFEFIESHPVERVVIDLRGNGGGNKWLNAPLEFGLIRAEKLWRPGGVVVITDCYTFSAAMNFVTFLSRTTPAIFVGEAAGGRPNHYGDAEQLVLPGTGLTVRLSTVYHQDSSTGDDRDQIDPHVPVPQTAADIRAGRDPALEEVLSWSLPGEIAGHWKGVATIRHYRTGIVLRLDNDGERWSGSFTATGWIDETAIESAGRVEDELRFEIPFESAKMRFRVRGTGDRLLGMFDYHGQWYPFVAGRSRSDD